MQDREAFRASMTQLVRDAEAALVRGEPGPLMQMWSNTDPVSLLGAVGVTKIGWDEIRRTLQAVSSRLSGGEDITYEIMSFDISDDVAWTAGLVRYTGRMDAGPRTQYALRLTHIYRREAGNWKIAHQHSDFQPVNQGAPADPSPR